MTTYQETNKGPGELSQKVVMVYPSERVEVRLTQAELELLLQQYEKELRKISWSKVAGLLGTSLGMLLSVVTANFKTFFWISGDSIRAIFIIIAVGTGLFMLYYLFHNLYYIFTQKPPDAHQMVATMVKNMRKQLEADFEKLKPTTFGE